MKYKHIKSYLWFMIFIFGVFLFFIIFFTKIKENFEENKENQVPYMDKINMPLNDTYTCHNKCNPNNVCYITGEQCQSDKDCYGCLDVNKTNPSGKIEPYTDRFSLVSKLYDSASYNLGKETPPPSYFKGVDLWTFQFKEGEKLYNKRYKPVNNLVKYPARQSMFGEFTSEEPLGIFSPDGNGD